MLAAGWQDRQRGGPRRTPTGKEGGQSKPGNRRRPTKPGETTVVPGSMVYADLHLPSPAIPATPENPSNFFVLPTRCSQSSATEKLAMGARNLPIKRKGGPKLIWFKFGRYMHFCIKNLELRCPKNTQKWQNDFYFLIIQSFFKVVRLESKLDEF